MMQASGTADEKQRISGGFVGVANLIFVSGIRDAVEILESHTKDSVHNEKQTGNNDDMQCEFLHIRIGNR